MLERDWCAENNKKFCSKGLAAPNKCLDRSGLYVLACRQQQLLWRPIACMHIYVCTQVLFDVNDFGVCRMFISSPLHTP